MLQHIVPWKMVVVGCLLRQETFLCTSEPLGNLSKIRWFQLECLNRGMRDGGGGGGGWGESVDGMGEVVILLATA